MMHKIAILKVSQYDRYGDDYGDTHWIQTIATSITDWQEVSDEQLSLLHKAQCRMGCFRILERPIDEKNFIAKTVDEYIKIAEEDAKKAAQEQIARETAALQRKLKKEAKTQDDKIKLFHQLKKELGQ